LSAVAGRQPLPPFQPQNYSAPQQNKIDQSVSGHRSYWQQE
jgi:hypothetical protein